MIIALLLVAALLFSLGVGLILFNLGLWLLSQPSDAAVTFGCILMFITVTS